MLACGLHPDVLHLWLGLGRSAIEFGPSGHRLVLGRSLGGVPLLLAFVAAQALLTTATLLRGAARLPVPAALHVGLPLALAVPVAMDFFGGMPEASDLLGFVAGGCATLCVVWAVSAAAEVAGLSWLPAPAAATSIAPEEGSELRRAHALALLARASEAVSDAPAPAASAATSQMPAPVAVAAVAETDGGALVEPEDHHPQLQQTTSGTNSSSLVPETAAAADETGHRSEEVPMSRRRASSRASVISAAAASNAASSPSRRRSPSARRRP